MEPPSTTPSAPHRSPPPPIPVAAGGGSTGCTPHLKRVLKSYQAAAVSSLQGPPGCLMAAAGGSPGSGDDDELPALAPFPIQQPPLLTPPDQSRCSERSETQLESYSISCFSVGGERRLCLPQILSTVLAEFSQPQINGVCDELHIFCSRCNAEQLDVLKATGVIPSSAPSCGLITKSDAERLCAALIHQGAPSPLPLAAGTPVPVYHECFGGASGSLLPDAYLGPCAPSVRCRECGLLFAPRRFVCHAHRARESRTCHWGFDSAHWRHYLLLDDRDAALADQEAAADVLAQFKAKFADDVAKRKQSPPPTDVRKKKSLRPGVAEEPGSGPPFMAIGSDPALWPQPQWARTSAFKPWSPIMPSSKEHHPHLPPTTLPTGAPLSLYARSSLPYSMVAYFPPGADMTRLHKLDPGIVKLDPDRPALCLLPPTAVGAAVAAQQRHLLKKQTQVEGEVVAKKEAPPSRTGSADSGQGGTPSKVVNGRVSADTEETMSNSSLSTLSGVEEVGVVPEDCLRGDACSVVPPELEGLWGAFERHAVGDRARQDIVREVQLLLATACQQRHLLGMGLAGYRLLLHQQQAAQQESERLPCKLGAGLGGLTPHLETPPAKSISPPMLPPSPAQPPSSSCDSKATFAPTSSPAVSDDQGEPMVLSREIPRPLVEKKLPLLAT